MSPTLTLLAASLWQKKGRVLVSIVAIALGVALGYAVQLINSSAAGEFARALAMLSGDADLTVRGPREGFDEKLFPRLASLPEVAVASPAIELDVRVVDHDEPLHVLGIDMFRAARLQPALVGDSEDPLDWLRADTVFLSVTAADHLGAKPGERIAAQVGLKQVDLRVAGLLSASAVPQRLAVMDIGAAQWRFQRLGTLTRIDLRLRPGVDAEEFAARLQKQLPAGVAVERPHSAVESNLRMSRAYRINLEVLALVALFTGSLLVFSTQTLSVVRRRGELALLRVLGMTRRRLARLLGVEGALIGIVGAAVGLPAGYWLALAAMAVIGPDLGAGFFAGLRPQLRLDAGWMLWFFMAGVLAALAGALLPALEAARTQPAQALRAGDEHAAYRRIQVPWPGMALALAGIAATLLPPVRGLPLFGYLAIALMLVGAILMLPWVCSRVFSALPPPPRSWHLLAVAQLQGAAAQTGVGLAPMVAAVGLMVAMAIMVASFRQSLDDWLHRVLPADLYVRAGAPGDTGFLDTSVQRAIALLPEVRRVDFSRAQQILLDPTLPRVTLLARDLDANRAAKMLPLVTPAQLPAPGSPAALWVSETVADIYKLRPGLIVRIPIAGHSVRFTVAGIWRDYARQNGALLIDRALYMKLSGDRTATEAGLWLAPGVTPTQAAQAVRGAVPGGERLDVSEPGEIRSLSLAIFDRTFAVTYALEASAVVIGLFGLSSAVAGQVLARRREFGVLRHIGMTRRQIASMLATEGALTSLLGLAMGLALGWAISLVLVHVVNRQSFHWSMELHIPWSALALFVLLMLALATVTAAVSGRGAMAQDAVRAVKEDW